MENDLLPKAAELMEWARSNREVRATIATVLDKRGYPSLGHLVDENPELFEELHDAMKRMLEELPNV